eukprot:3440044-Amphidinium_carterae.1
MGLGNHFHITICFLILPVFVGLYESQSGAADRYSCKHKSNSKGAKLTLNLRAMAVGTKEGS